MHSRYAYRLELIEKYFIKGGCYLDLGCGSGLNTRKIADLLEASPYGIDVIDANQGDIDFRVYDGLNIPFEDNYFQSLSVIHVLHHAENADHTVAEIARVTKPGSRILVLEDMASSRFQNFLSKAGDVYANKVRNFFKALVGRRRFSILTMPMNYDIRSYPAWIETFRGCKLEVLALHSVAHGCIEHGAFVLENTKTA
jgi:ubiquinone/menaquinone biosynthesis C-methylase UbiE